MNFKWLDLKFQSQQDQLQNVFELTKHKWLISEINPKVILTSTVILQLPQHFDNSTK